jgi:dienelactone hydrolase
MTNLWRIHLGAATLVVATIVNALAQPLVPIETGFSVELTSQVPQGKGFTAERVTATLFEADAPLPVPAAVIINSSGGVMPHTELFWGRLLAAHGITALVVDSFTARGVVRTSDDQRRMAQSQSDADAVAAFRFLAARPRVDSERILVMGMSKGGQTALATAYPGHMTWLGAANLRFAAHIALTPGGCDIQYRDVRTTNRPILFLLADLDDQTPATNCLDLAERMRKSGNAGVERAVYPGVYHAMEWTGGLDFDAAEEIFGRCRGFLEADGTYSMGTPAQKVSEAQFRTWLERNCMTHGGHAGGDAASKRHLVEDLLRFLQANGFIRDAAIDAVLGNCDRFAGEHPRRLCDRGRAGYVGDIVALARALRDGENTPRDDVYAARLFRVAAERGNPRGQFWLAQMLQEGRGVPQDQQAALLQLRLAVDQDYAPSMNSLGVAYRDGTGVAKDEQIAARLFRRGALNRDSWAMANLGLFTLTGRGGVAPDPAEAVRLIRESALLGNPWGQFSLAKLHEIGDVVLRDPIEARRQYGLSAQQTWKGQADARAAVARLATPPASVQVPRTP